MLEDNPITVVRSEDGGTITASMEFTGDPKEIINQHFNRIAYRLLTRLSEEVAKETEYEFDGVTGMTVDTAGPDLGVARMPINLFVP